MNGGAAFCPRGRKLTVWNSLLRKRTESPARIRIVAGKNWLTSVSFGVPAGALPGEPAQAVHVLAAAVPGTTAPAASAAPPRTSKSLNRMWLQLLVGGGGCGAPARRRRAQPNRRRTPVPGLPRDRAGGQDRAPWRAGGRRPARARGPPRRPARP